MADNDNCKSDSIEPELHEGHTGISDVNIEIVKKLEPIGQAIAPVFDNSRDGEEVPEEAYDDDLVSRCQLGHIGEGQDRWSKNMEASARVNGISGGGGGGGGKSIARHTGRDDRATTENVMDPRTRMILFRMLASSFLKEINGCISTGKEANVYYAVAGAKCINNVAAGEHLAVKVFKTSILVFKDRDRYVSGEYRFRHGYCKSNPRKMVKIWAEKEMRNLKRLHTYGVRCPEPILIRNNVLIMKFIGKDGWPSPRLKDATLSEKKLRKAYQQCVEMMRIMFQKCKLVHGDLSEYNILYKKGNVYFIDVSQSVEHEHPSAMDFLRMDCSNITAFFSKKGLATMSTRELFTFVTNEEIKDDQVGKYLEKMSEKAQQSSESIRSKMEMAQEEVDEAVFMQSFIPRALNEVRHFEEEHQKLMSGDTKDVYIGKAVKHEFLNRENGEERKSNEKSTNIVNGINVNVKNDEDKELSEEEIAKLNTLYELKINAPPPEPGTDKFNLKKQKDKNARKEHKRLIKEAKALARKNKIPKKVKKRAKILSRKKS